MVGSRRLFERLEERILLDAAPDPTGGLPGPEATSADAALTADGAGPAPYVAEAVAWPATDADWVALTSDGTPYSEPQGEPGVGQDFLDIVGDATYPAAYWYSDGTNLMFRIRVDAMPPEDVESGVWQILFDFDGDAYVDWSLQLDEHVHEEVELVEAIIGGPKFKSGTPGPGDAIELSETQVWPADGPTVDPTYWRWSVAGDGSSFGGDADAFLDMAIPWTALTSATGVESGDPFGVAITTSASREVTNQDTPADFVYDVWTDPVNEPAPELGIAKEDGLDTVQPGDTVTYTLTVTNSSTTDATGVVVTDTIPAHTAFVGASDGGTESGGVVTWPTFDLAAGGTVTRTVTVAVVDQVPAGVDEITNTATVTDDGCGGPDPDPSNNTASDTDALEAQPDLTLIKDDGLTDVVPGQTVTYVLTVSNVGDQHATGVVLTDLLPDHTVFVSADGGGSESGGVVSWPTFDLAAGGTVTRSVTVSVANPVPAGVAEITDTAAVTDDETNGADPTPWNNTATDTDTLVAAPDLTIAKENGVALVQPGETVTYILTITNNGDQDATGVVVADALPAYTTFVGASDGGTESGGVVTWSIGAVAAGTSVERTVTVQVDATIPAGVESITNTADVADDGANGVDPNPGDNTGTDTDALEAAPDLTVTKDDGLTEVVPGQTVVYTLTITNNGDQDATGVVVADTLPTSTSFVSASDGGTESGGVVTWNIGALAAGASVQRTVTIQVDATIPAGVEGITNTASAADDGTGGEDQNPGDNTGTDTNTVYAVPDLAVGKDDGLTSVTSGQTLTYTVTISNQGTQGATGVTVTDTLPQYTTFVGASGGGVCSDGVVTWEVGGLAAGETVTRTVTVQVDPLVPPGVTFITNAVTVADDGTNGPEPNLSDNQDTDTDEVAVGVIGDRVWRDMDGDGRQDPGERGIEGATVYLTWPGRDGAFGTPDDVQISTVTSWGGHYSFGDLPAGQYMVSVDEATVRPRSRRTTPDPLTVTLGPAEEYLDADFGFMGFAYDVYNNAAEAPAEPSLIPGPLPAAFAFMPLVYSGTSVPGTSLVVTVSDSQGYTAAPEAVLVGADGSWVIVFAQDAVFGYAGRTGQPLAATTGFRLDEGPVGLFYPESVITMPAGDWQVEHGPAMDGPQVLTTEQGGSALTGSGVPAFNLRTYSAPAYSTGLFSVEWLTADYVTARSTFTMVDVLYASDLQPLGVGWVAFGHELLCASWVPSGY
jgi:uncharacterized repeat protein (TIGR01451 family)